MKIKIFLSCQQWRHELVHVRLFTLDFEHPKLNVSQNNQVYTA